jgi:hypothetical protein
MSRCKKLHSDFGRIQNGHNLDCGPQSAAAEGAARIYFRREIHSHELRIRN